MAQIINQELKQLVKGWYESTELAAEHPLEDNYSKSDSTGLFSIFDIEIGIKCKGVTVLMIHNSKVYMPVGKDVEIAQSEELRCELNKRQKFMVGFKLCCVVDEIHQHTDVLVENIKARINRFSQERRVNKKQEDNFFKRTLGVRLVNSLATLGVHSRIDLFLKDELELLHEILEADSLESSKAKYLVAKGSFEDIYRRLSAAKNNTHPKFVTDKHKVFETFTTTSFLAEALDKYENTMTRDYINYIVSRVRQTAQV